MPICARSSGFAVVVALVVTACRPPCPDVAVTAPMAEPPPPAEAAPPVETRPRRGPPPSACALSPDEVRARTGAYLAGLAGAEELPPSFTPVGACTSHCVDEGQYRAQAADRCDSWECMFRYAKARPWFGDGGQFAVHVIGCGARVFAEIDLAACFAKPHRCALVVDRAQAEALAGRYFGEFDVLLEWTAEAEFRWQVRHGEVELATIGVHVSGDIRPPPGAPPLRPRPR